MPRAAEDAPKIEVRSRGDLRQWLSQNHDRGVTVWLVTFKKGSPHYLPRDEMVEELIAWGWIDSLPRKLDDARSSVLIAPRNPKSAWSAISKRHVETARASGAMTPAGEAAVAVADQNGMWSFLDEVERLEVPDDLARALGADRSLWDEWAPSRRRGELEKIKWAKTPETRAKRIEQAIAEMKAARR